jgi:hypothetical protein
MGGCPAPVDLTYGSGVPSPALAAQQAQNDPATAMAVMQAHPFEVEQIAMQFKVPRATAAMMLLADARRAHARDGAGRLPERWRARDRRRAGAGSFRITKFLLPDTAVHGSGYVLQVQKGSLQNN